MEMVGIASLLTAVLSLSAAAQSAHTALKDKSGKDVGVVELTQTPGGAASLFSENGLAHFNALQRAGVKRQNKEPYMPSARSWRRRPCLRQSRC